MPDQSWRLLHRVADAHLYNFVRPYTDSVHTVRARITDEVVAEALSRGLTEPPHELLALLEVVVIAKEADPRQLAQQAYAEVLAATVHSMYDYVRSTSGERAAELVGSFNVTSPQVLRAAQTLTANLVRGVTRESRNAIRRIIFNAVRDGIAPRDAAVLIRNVIGLTERQALSVAAYRSGLVQAKTPPVRLERLVGRLAERKLKDRALNIARTETMRAANRGQQLLWESMARDRLVDTRTFRQRWVTTPDDRLCPRCAPMDGQTVHLGGSFEESQRGVLPSQRTAFAGETVQSPPLHPRCRCTLVRDDV